MKVNTSTIEVAVGLSPNQADVAIVSTDYRGTPGQLNSYVLSEYGYSIKEMPTHDRLTHGFSSITKKGKKPIITIVTVSNTDTAELLSTNLYSALTEFRGWFRGLILWVPLMGTGSGGLSLEESYLLTDEAISRFQDKYPTEGRIIISLPDNEDGYKLLSIINRNKGKNIDISSATEPNYYFVGSYWNGAEQASRFIEGDIWENGHDEKFGELVESVKRGDILFLKSTFSKDESSYLRVKAIGVVFHNPEDGSNLRVNWRVKLMPPIDIEGFGKYRSTIARVMPHDIDRLLNEVGREKLIEADILPNVVNKPNNRDGSIETLALINNTLQNAGVSNDGAQTDKDLLGFDNDIRAFAALIALKELKPPLAIALFGQWGSGKSFFIYNLQKKIDFLSNHQGFEMRAGDEMKGAGEKDMFCKGIVQITFNAWSYMDANLWASLAANIFERLDEYITNESKGSQEEEKARNTIKKNLKSINDAQLETLGERKQLLVEKQRLEKLEERIEKEKDDLLKDVESKIYSDIYEDINRHINVEETVVVELKKYGITKDITNWFSLEAVYNEITDWKLFCKNFLMFKKWQIICIGVAVIIFIILWANFDGLTDRYTKWLAGLISSVSIFAIPIANQFYSTAKRLLSLYKPIKSYKNKFNKQLEIISNKYGVEIQDVKENALRVKVEIEVKDKQLAELSVKINSIELQLNNSVVGKAFFDFIKNKTKDERYDKNLGIITTIRRDLETLSQLFSSYNEDSDLLLSAQYKDEKKRKELEEFKTLFNKPLDRIVLYIDDLDRCPEDRVIEVLEAVNLLMAFPLFVVVVGVDPRWVKNALVKKYTLQFTGMLNGKNDGEYGVERINVTDYLEKIFQIPFYLREADASGVGKLIDDMLISQLKEEKEEDNSDGIYILDGSNDTGSDALSFGNENLQSVTVNNRPRVNEKIVFRPSDLKFDREELKDLKSLAWLIGTNPRSLKRYVNIYRIIRAHENLSYNQGAERKSFLAIMFLLGLSIGAYKDFAHSFYLKCDESPESSLDALVKLLDLKDVSTLKSYYLEKDMASVMKDITGEHFQAYIPFVRRFSFNAN